ASPSIEKGNSNNLIVVLGTSGCLNVDVTLLKNRRWLCGCCLPNLIAIKAAKPEVISTAATKITTSITTPRDKGIVFHEQVQAHIPTVSSSKDKGKEKMIELEKPLKKKDQITLDEEVARKLEAKMEEEERITR
nr:hypothetical protein [Tanacetum cinerariifolium]